MNKIYIEFSSTEVILARHRSPADKRPGVGEGRNKANGFSPEMVGTGAMGLLSATRLYRLTFYLSFLGLVSGSAHFLAAQDTRYVPEPAFPKTCAVYRAPLISTPDGPGVGPSTQEQDSESAAETKAINWYLVSKCSSGQALELALGRDSSSNAFLINPITLPEGVSLIVDGGVTVYGSRDPANYQTTSATNAVCGTIGHYGVDQGCLALVTVSSSGGVYGYGVIDGQGNKPLLSGINYNSTWWSLTINKKQGSAEGPCPQPDPAVSNPGDAAGDPNTPCEQSSPVVISSANITGVTDTDLTLYKITIRNPPYHTIRLIGDGITVWGAKVQAPWNLPNTDGFDVRGCDITFYDTTVANGDQQIVLVSNGGPTKNVTVDHFHGYSKGGFTILGTGDTTSQILVKDSEMTGDLPSVVRTTVDGKSEVVINGVPEDVLLSTKYGLKSYGQALPNATNELQGLQITNKGSDGTQTGSQISDVTFRSICMSDLIRPINLLLSPETNAPSAVGIRFEDIHVLKPTIQLPQMTKGIVADPFALAGYQVYLDSAVVNNVPQIPNQVSFQNVVFDRADTGNSSLASISALGNEISTLVNIYPRIFNQLEAGPTQESKTVDNIDLTLLANSYTGKTPVSVDFLAKRCRPMPFTAGDLYLSGGAEVGRANNLQKAVIREGDTITLNAVIQPVMSQTTLFVGGSYGADPGLLALASPALTNPVKFYDRWRLIGTAKLSANGTLASFRVGHLSPGAHYFRAEYPGDRYYKALVFGSAVVKVAHHRF